MEINYVSVVAIVMGLSQFIKTKLSLVDTAAELLSAVIGFVLGGLYQYGVTQPVDFNGWFAVLLVALSTWLVPSGLYKLGVAFAVRSASENK